MGELGALRRQSGDVGNRRRGAGHAPRQQTKVQIRVSPSGTQPGWDGALRVERSEEARPVNGSGHHVVSGNGAASDVENLQDKVVGAPVQEEGGAGRVKAMSARGGVKEELDAVSAQPGGCS